MHAVSSIVFAAVLALVFGSSVMAQVPGAAGSGFGAELGAIPFEAIIGNPLKAVVIAQSMAAQTTAGFINDVGFSTPSGEDVKEVVMVSFNYKQDINGTLEDRSMSVPFLFIIPIPFLQFDLVTLDFSVKLSSLENHQDSTDTTSTSSFSSASKSFWGTRSSKFSASVTTQSKNANSATVTRDYSLVIHVQGSQAPLPEGMRKIMDLFDQIVRQGAPKV